MVLEVVLLMILWLICCFASAGIGFFFARKRENLPRKNMTLTPEQKQQAERIAQELKNFWEYTGDEQEPINQQGLGNR